MTRRVYAEEEGFVLRGISRNGFGGLALLLATVLIAAGPASAAGFSIFEAGSRATGQGGAFVATADDLSAMFYNPAGLGFQAEKGKLKSMVGVTLIIPNSKLSAGLDPYPGAGYTVSQKSMIFFPPSFYASYGLSECVSLSLGTWFPFGLSTAWEDSDTYRGTYISQRVDLRQYSLGLQVAWKINDYISVGAGPEVRIGDVKLQGNVPLFNPYSNSIVTAAHADLVSDGFEFDLAWGAGIKVKPTPEMSIGASYHSAVTVDYTGAATFTQRSTGHTDLDALIASRLPVNQPVPLATAIEFPAVTQVGLSYTFGQKLTAEVAGTFTQWDVLQSATLSYGAVDGKQVPSTVIPFNYENAWAYRFGLNYKASDKMEVLAGFVYDQTPQPDLAVSPLLPDANRSGYSLGMSSKVGKHSAIDFSVLYLYFHERTTTTNKDNFNGTYQTTAWLPVFHFRTSF